MSYIKDLKNTAISYKFGETLRKSLITQLLNRLDKWAPTRKVHQLNGDKSWKNLKEDKNCSENAAPGRVFQPELDIQEEIIPRKRSSKCKDEKVGKYHRHSEDKEEAHLAAAKLDWVMESWEGHTGRLSINSRKVVFDGP